MKLFNFEVVHQLVVLLCIVILSYGVTLGAGE